jgi:tRNA-specific 2-thiouridylase
VELNGRRRTAQFALAKEYGLQSYPSPAGGCLLTEPNFCVRLKELREHEGYGDRRLVRLLRVGRHFRLPSGTKLVIGREEADNARISAMVRDDYELVLTRDRPSPTGLLPAGASPQALQEAAAVIAFYAKCPPEGTETIEVRRGGVCLPPIESAPLTAAQIEAWRIG